jgi:hypothetical protein
MFRPFVPPCVVCPNSSVLKSFCLRSLRFLLFNLPFCFAPMYVSRGSSISRLTIPRFIASTLHRFIGFVHSCLSWLENQCSFVFIRG